MKRFRRQFIKTETSICETEFKKEEKQDWVLLSSQRQKKLSCTPMRFANLALKTKTQEKQIPSTQDREESSKQKPSYPAPKKSSITEAIHVLKELSNGAEQRSVQERNSITPFELTSQESFEPQISFKGVSNRLCLLGQIDKIQQEVFKVQNKTQILFFKEKQKQSQINIKTLGHKKNQQASSFSQISDYLRSMFKEQEDFRTELYRCRDIMQTQAGIAQKSLTLYLTRFQSLIQGMTDNLTCLQKYMNLTLEPPLQTNPIKRKIKISRFNGW